MILKIEKEPSYKLRLSGNVDLIRKLKSKLKGRTSYTFRNLDNNLETVIKPFSLYRKIRNKEQITIDQGLLDYLYSVIGALPDSHSIRIEGLENIQKPLIPQPLEKWIKIFSEHPRGFGDLQLKDFKILTSFTNGILEVFTGYGKTEILCCICDTFKDYVQHIAILAPSNQILEEIDLRLNKYEISHGLYNSEYQINVINPVSLMARSNSSFLDNWLELVELVICDEVHHIQCKSYSRLFRKIKKVLFSYGLSASSDVAEGKPLNPFDTPISLLSPKTAKVVGLAGPVRIRRKLPIPVDLKVVNTRISARSEVVDKTWQESLDLILENQKTSIIIKKLIRAYPDRNFFIPIHKKISGEILYKNLIITGLPCLFWSSDKVLTNTGDISECSLSAIKNLVISKQLRIVMSTIVEGVDLKNLNAIIPLCGVSYRTVVQPIGRSARMNDLLIVLINDLNNPKAASQSSTRRSIIENNYNIRSFEDLTM